MTATPWMDHAWSHIGLKETPGKKATPAIVEMYAKAGNAGVTSDEVPWCAAFVGACLADAGLPNTGSLLARSYLKYGTPLTEPRVGAIAIIKRGPPPQGHVFFVTGWEGGRIRGLGGNQGNAVSEATFATSEVLGYRWPPVAEQPGHVETVAVPVPKPVIKSRTAWNIGIGGSFLTWLGDVFSTGMQTLTEAGAQFAALAPSRDLLAILGGNSKTIAISIGVGCLFAALCNKIGDSVPKDGQS